MFLKRFRLFAAPIVVLLLLLCSHAGGRARQRKADGDFPLERDHVFVWVSPGAPEAAALQKLGLYTDGTVHKHVGQGTSSVVFSFENAYLELIWVDDAEVAGRKSREVGADFLERVDWKRTGASPFGVGLRRRAGAADIPFQTKRYWAEWMKPDTFILIAESSADDREPFYFVVPDYMAVPPAEQLRQMLEARPEYRKNFTHALGLRRLTGLKITTAAAGKFSDAALALSRHGVAALRRGKSHLAELTFDGGARGKSVDARPALPIILRY